MHRERGNPILTRDDVPDVPGVFRDVTSVFNPGAVRVGDHTVLLVRVQTRGRRTHLLRAVSDDGVAFTIEPELIRFDVAGAFHVYDPRITPLDDGYLVTVAVDTDAGCRVGVATSRDMRTFTWKGLTDDADTRNAVLFPAKIGGRYARLDRPNRTGAPGDPSSGSAIRYATSTDLLHWEDHGAVMRGTPRYWDERIGSGPPPVLTAHGWLHVYHGVATHFESANVYQAGAVLLDRDDPTRVLARTRDNILEPRERYEMVGQVPNVVFPSGWTVESPVTEDSRVCIYYGAADTCIALARTTIGELIDTCREGGFA